MNYIFFTYFHFTLLSCFLMFSLKCQANIASITLSYVKIILLVYSYFL